MKNIKETKGITLIALVITIIVLLILAGIAISMLSGENGILTRASEAKKQTKEAQKEEETNLASMELDTYFITNNSKYKCAYGYITGVSNDRWVTIAEFENELKQYGLKITKKYEYDEDLDTGEYKEIKENEKNDTYITTGMVVEKDGKEIAKTVIFGDNDFDGDCSGTDVLNLYAYGINQERYKNLFSLDFVKVAMDVNHNGIIDGDDLKLMQDFSLDDENNNIVQEAYAKDPKQIKYDTNSIN